MTVRAPGLPGGRKGDVVEATGGRGSEVGPEDGAELPPPEDGPIAGGAAPDGQAQTAVPEMEPLLQEAVTAATMTTRTRDTAHAWWIKDGRVAVPLWARRFQAALPAPGTTHDRRALPSGQRPGHLALRNSCSHPSLQPPPP